MIFALAFSFAQVEESRQHPFDDAIKGLATKIEGNGKDAAGGGTADALPLQPHLIKRRRGQVFNCGERHHPSRPVLERHG